MAKNKKTKNNKKNNNKIENNTKQFNDKVEIKENKFISVVKKKPVSVVIHIVTIMVWVVFLQDFITFQARGTYPNIMLSLVALITFILEYNILKDKF